MAASITDKVTDTRNAARPNSARATGTRSAAGVSLTCDNLAGWPTASKVHFVTYQVDSSSNPVAGTQLDCSGIVSGNTIGSFTVIDGTDLGNAVGDYVEMLPTAAWGQDLSDVLTSTHNRSGGLKTGLTIPSPTLTTPTIADYTSATHTHQSASQGGVLTGAALPNLALNTQSLSNPYKFEVYRNAAWTDGNGAYALVTFDTKVYDTNTNYAIATGKYTAPVAGFYDFSWHVGATIGGGSLYFTQLYLNGVGVASGNGGQQGAGGFSKTSVGSVTGLQLAANDFVQIYSYGDGNAGQTGRVNTGFSGGLRSQT